MDLKLRELTLKNEILQVYEIYKHCMFMPTEEKFNDKVDLFLNDNSVKIFACFEQDKIVGIMVVSFKEHKTRISLTIREPKITKYLIIQTPLQDCFIFFYFSNELNTNKEYYEFTYDDVVIPDVLAGVHPKSAITKRNRWMAENSDFVVTYVYRDFGGAYDAKKYALKLGKTVFETNDMLTDKR